MPCGAKPKCGSLAQTWWVVTNPLLLGEHRAGEGRERGSVPSAPRAGQGWERGSVPRAGEREAVFPLLLDSLLLQFLPCFCLWREGCPVATIRNPHQTNGIAVHSLKTGLSFPTCVFLSSRNFFFFFLGHWEIGMYFLNSVLCCNMHTKKWLQKLREFLNNQIIAVYGF